jgi:hypothetical protein
METRNIKITLETATRWFNGCDKELKDLAVQTFPELAKKELPKKWEELDEIKGYYVNEYSDILEADCSPNRINRNVFATKEQAKASITLAQLSQLREVYRNGWKPDWTVHNEKYCIAIVQDKITEPIYYCASAFLSFQDKETRDLFIENFSDLIEKAKPLM